MMISSRIAQKAISKQKILQAAASCFSEFGIASSSISQITQRAGVSHGLLYVHFKDKQALVLALVEHEYQAAITDFEQLSAQTTIDGVLTLLATCVRDVSFPVDHRLWLNILAEAVKNSELNQLHRQLDLKMRATLAQLLSKILPIDSRSIEATILFIYAAIDGLIIRRAIDPCFDIEQYLPFFQKTILHLLTNQSDKE